MQNTEDKSPEKAIKSSKKKSKLQDHIDRFTQFSHIDRAVVLLCVCFIAFKGQIEELLKSSKLLTLISSFEANSATNFIFIAASLIFIYQACVRYSRPKYITTRHFIYWVVPAILLLYYRFVATHVWEFTALHGYERIKYVDLYLVQAGLISLTKIISKLQTCIGKKADKTECKRLLDKEIWDKDDDILNRLPYVKAIASDLSTLKSKSHSPILAIQAPWGSGKSSFIHMLENEINESYPDTIVLNFNPWSFEDKKTLSESFYAHLYSELSHFHTGIKIDLTSYFQTLVNVSKPYLSLFFHWLSRPQNQLFKNKRDAINHSICKINKHIVVMIDDIDRLKPEEILEVFKLLRNNASFTNVSYVVTYDREYVMRSLDKAGVVNSEKYPDKIFEMVYDLPIIHQDDLKKFLSESLKAMVETQDVVTVETAIYGSPNLPESDMFMSSLITNLRTAKKFINVFMILYRVLKKDTYLNDLLNVSLLRVLYPSVFELFIDKADDFIVLYFNKFILKDISDNNDGKYDIKETKLWMYLSDNSTLLSINPLDINNILKLVNKLFYHGKKTKNADRIFYEHRYKRYFIRELTPKEISNKEFKTKLLENPEEIEYQINTWIIAGKGINLIKRLQSNDYTDVDELEIITRASFYALDKFENYSNKDNYCMQIDRLHQIKKYVEREDEFLKNYLLSFVPSRFLMRFLFYLYCSRRNQLFQDFKVLNIVIIEHYKHILDNNPLKDKILLCCHKSLNLVENRSTYNSDAKLLFNEIVNVTTEYINQDLENRLFVLIVRDEDTEDLWTFSPITLKIFNQERLTTLFNLLMASETRSGQELHRFWTKFINNNAEPTEFKFKYNQ